MATKKQKANKSSSQARTDTVNQSKKENVNPQKTDTKPKSRKDKKAAGPPKLPFHHLTPFALGVFISFIWFLPHKPALETMTLGRMLLKCLPILYLAAYVGLKDAFRGESAKVFFALLFSAIGDACLAFHDICFIYGLAAFAVAHTFYSKTFGFEATNFLRGGALYFTNFGVLSYFALPYIHPVSFRVAMTIYSLFLVTMGWRAIDRYLSLTSPCYERRLCSALGGITFMFSDSCYVFLQMMEYLPHIPAQLVILSTYYLAQLLLALGSCENFWGPERNYPKKRRA